MLHVQLLDPVDLPDEGPETLGQQRILAWISVAALGLAYSGSGLASENRIAVAPGGPHPYFAPWEQAAADAKKDFGIASVDYKVPSDWKLELQQELLESLATQGYKG